MTYIVSTYHWYLSTMVLEYSSTIVVPHGTRVPLYQYCNIALLTIPVGTRPDVYVGMLADIVVAIPAVDLAIEAVV